MKMNWLTKATLAVILPATLALAGCGSSVPDQTKRPPGFLPNYSLLKPVDNTPEGMQIYNYKAPGVNRSDYHAVIVNPVVIYQAASLNGVTQPQIEAARATIQAGIQNVVRQRLPLTDTPGPGVAKVTVAITGATVDGQSFQVYNIIPVSAAIYLASKATDLDSKTPVMIVELKFVDSVSGKLLRETVTVINGDTFRNKANTSGEFAQLAQNWVKEAMQYSPK